MKDAKTSTSLQMLASIFETFLESPEAEITAILVIRYEQFPRGNSGNVQVSVQGLVYGGKTVGVGASSKPLHRNHELLSSSKEALGHRKNRGPSEGLETHVWQRTSPKEKGLVEKPKHFVRGPEEIVRL
ncbi:hypothetical protein O181_000496 [Austropuccinia psidii MF-1]|uniref:Uncharacterized protein n=1 Tax=Austropuccinia psidii MF-1 TaxID=1389203 RepID=A0A9Q3GBM7_9BASI|nr:hypothetical protein [Austropuccinia psidii MF-1]